METIKNALGYGQQSGEEPVSGQTGEGTATKPFDTGNAQDGTTPASPTSPSSATAAAATAASATQSGVEPVSGVQGSGSALSPYDAGNSDDKQLGGQAPQLALPVSNVDGAGDASAAAAVIGSTNIKPLEPAATADATAAQDQVIASTDIKPLEPDSSASASASAAAASSAAVDDKVIEDATIKPLDPEPSTTSTTAAAVETVKAKVEDKITPSAETDKPLPATPAKTSTADPTMTATPQIEKSAGNTPNTTGSHSKRDKFKEKIGSIKAKFSSSPKQ